MFHDGVVPQFDGDTLTQLNRRVNQLPWFHYLAHEY